MKINVIVLGATGMVGEGVLHVALQSEEVERVLVLGRRTCGVSHPKLTEIVHTDLHDISSLAPQLTGYHACFFCLGVSSIGKSEDVYRRTTYDLTMHIAGILSTVNSGMTFCYVSGSGTDSSEKGKQMWARVKGKTENDLRTLPFRRAFAFRPGFIKPIDGMNHTLPMTTTIGRFYPLLKRLFPNAVCTLESLGRSMVSVSINGYPKDIIDNNDIHTITLK
jgi:uncharacterized protein YbjT (DUF2867 family)